jgi:dCTP deaminase
MSVLTKNKILDELEDGKDGKGLIITPLSLKQIGPSSVDLHLGNEFIIFRRASIKCVDVEDAEKLVQNVHKYQEKIRISKKDNFILHPGQLVLGATQEYIALPEDISAVICGRSTWGRTGLIIATATQIATSFKGCITLELVNDGEIPLVLYPGLRVAQLLLYRTEGKCFDVGSYQFQTGPKFPKIEKEREYLRLRSRKK